MSASRTQLSCAIAVALASVIAMPVSAQVVFSENFTVPPPGTCNSGGPFPYLPAGWTRFNVDNSVPNAAVSYVTEAWIVREDFASDVNQCAAFSTSWYNPAGTANDFLCTPQIALPAAAVLSWRGLTYDASYRDGYEVRLMRTAPTAGTGVIGNLLSASTVVFSTGAENATWTNRQVDLAAAGFLSEPAWVCFRNNSVDKFLLLIDDVTVSNVAVDVSAVAPAAPLRYSRVPSWAGYAIAPAVSVANIGGVPVTNVSVLAEALLAGTVDANTPSTPIAALPTGATVPAAFTATLPVDAAGDWTVRYTVSLTQVDTAVGNNVITSSNLVAGANEVARDTGAVVGTLGIGAGNGGELGQQFDLPVAVSLQAIRYSMAPNGDVTWPGRDVVANLRAWDTVNNRPGTLIASTVPFVSQAAAAVVDAGFAAGPQLLVPGRYVVTVSEPVGGPAMTLHQTAQIFTPGTVWVNWPTIPGGNWTNAEAFGAAFSRTFQVSMLVDALPDDAFRNGFEDPPPVLQVHPAAPLRVQAPDAPATRRSVEATQLAPRID